MPYSSSLSYWNPLFFKESLPSSRFHIFSLYVDHGHQAGVYLVEQGQLICGYTAEENDSIISSLSGEALGQSLSVMKP